MADSELEVIKRASRHLRGGIAEGLEDTTTGAIADDDTKLLKFHGMYQQDDRDVRAERRDAKLEPLYSFMIRIRLPGGVATNEQWKAIDHIAETVANGTLRITTRQTIQYHGVYKEDLRTLVQHLDAVELDSRAACGDVNRNVVCHVQPDASPVHGETLHWARQLSEHFLPQSGAWREIWINGEKLADEDAVEEEPFYGDVYLPRKFKIGIALPPVNDIDVYSQDLGFIAITEGDKLLGFNVVVGGGMGCAHGDPKTFPRLGNVLGFVTPDNVLSTAEAVLGVQRDYGNRKERSQARFKYTVETKGLEWIKEEVERRSGVLFAEAKPYHFTQNGDRYGWIEQLDGRWQLTVFVENGRLLPQHRAGINNIVDAQLSGDIRLTTNQNLIVAGVAASDREKVDAIIQSSGLGSENVSAIRLHSMACVAFPTCGLAMAEAERYLPSLLTRIEELAARHGVADQPITVRMSGCPNGCSRPYLAELAFVGRAPGRYNMYVGAAFDGSRLSRVYLDNADEASILAAVDELFAHYAAGRHDQEAFGDYLIRAGLVETIEHGSEVHVESAK